MRPILINPRERRIKTFEVPTQLAAAAMTLCKPYTVAELTSDHVIFYSALSVLGEDRHLFWSKRLEAFICGNALVFGTRVDGYPADPGLGMLNAVRNDVIFLGEAAAAQKTIKTMLMAPTV